MGRGTAPQGGREQTLLCFTQCCVDLNQLNVETAQELRHPSSRAQRVAHQRAAARAQLDEAQRRWASHALPDHGAPQPDQLAEYLADLGRGYRSEERRVGKECRL